MTARRWTTALATLLFSASPLAQAALTNCRGVSENPGSYLVLLDDFSAAAMAAPAPEAPAASAEDTRLFGFYVKAQVEALQAKAREAQRRNVPLVVVECAGRSPSFVGNEFTANIVERLDDSGVVVEVWGAFDRSAPPDASAVEVRAAYLMPPLKRYAPQDDASPYVLKNARLFEAGTTDRVALPHLETFAMIGLGTKARLEREYDLAAWALRQACDGLDRAGQRSASDLAPLRAYIEREVGRVRAEARAARRGVSAMQLPVFRCRGGT